MRALPVLQSSGWTLLALAAWSCGVTAVHAQETSEPVTLEYHAPATCPDAAEFVRRVREKTGKFHPVVPELGSRLFVVTVDGAGPSRGQLSIRGGKTPQAERAVEGDSCDEVVSALALATALAVDPRSGSGEVLPPLPAPEPPKEEPGEEPKPPKPRALETPSVPAPVTPPPRPSWALGAYGLSAIDVAPNPLIGPGVWAEVKNPGEKSATVYQLGIEHAWSKEAVRSEVPVDFSRTLVRLGVCPFARSFGSAEAMVCGQASAGVLRASTRGVQGATDDTRFWGAAGAELQVRIGLARSIGLMVGGGFDVAFERDWYVYRPEVELHRVAPVSGFAKAGLFHTL